MSLYDSVRDLPLTVESYSLEGLEQQVSSGFLRKSTVIRLAGAGEEGLGEDVTYEADEHDLVQARGASPSARGRVDDRDVLASTSRRCRSSTTSPSSTPTSTTAAGPTRAPRSISRCARQAGRSATRSAGRARAADVRRLDAARRAGDDRSPAGLARALPDPAVQARRDARLVGRADRRARGDGRRRLGRLQGPVPRHGRRHRARPRRSTSGSSTACPTPGSRIRRSRPRPRRCSSRTTSASPGTP